MNAAQLINQDSGDTEYYTPQNIVDAARTVMGGIDLDPFSSVTANVRVNAKRIFTVADDGLKQKWRGKIWMNHPFSKVMNPLCVQKLESEYIAAGLAQEEMEALCITFAATSEKWFRPLLNRPQCFLTPRTNYFLPDGTQKKGVTKGSVVTYYGNNVKAFYKEFKWLGVVKVPYISI